MSMCACSVGLELHSEQLRRGRQSHQVVVDEYYSVQTQLTTGCEQENIWHEMTRSTDLQTTAQRMCMRSA